MNLKLSSRMMLPWLAGLAVLLGVWLLPLPGQVFGDEQFSAARMPQTRTDIETAAAGFERAKNNYYAFVHSHDMQALLATVQRAVAEAKANPGDPARIAALRDQAGQVRDYTAVLSDYADAGEQLFPLLRYYDDELMGYTRSVTPPTNEVRTLTFPLADHMRLYPPPVGDLAPDPPWVPASEVRSQLASISTHLAALNSQAPTVPATVDAISKDVANVWESGRSIERVESLHSIYLGLLQTYDTQIQEVARTGNRATLPAWRKIASAALTGAVGLLVLAGVAFLLMPQRRQTEAGPAS